MVSQKDFETLKRLAEGKTLIYGKPTSLRIDKKYNIGFREFVSVKDVLAVNGVSVESLKGGGKHDRERVQKEVAGVRR